MQLAQAEFEELAVAELNAVNRLARRLSRNATYAEDLVQETYLRAIRFRGTFELHEFGIRPWLSRIVQSVHFNHLRRERRQPTTMNDEHLESATSEAEWPLADDPNGFQCMDQRLVGAINSLKAPYRQALLLWAVHDLNYAEIAAELEIPIGTVMSRLHRARKQLRDRLGDSLPEKRDLQHTA